MQVGNLTEINKRAGWNKGVQVGKFLKFNKICCTIIRDLKVHRSISFVEFPTSSPRGHCKFLTRNSKELQETLRTVRKI